MDENIFALFHAYNKLVRRGLVKPLTCQCGGNMVTGLRKHTMIDEDELVLDCYDCGSVTVPGEATLDDVRAVVKEHFIGNSWL